MTATIPKASHSFMTGVFHFGRAEVSERPGGYHDFAFLRPGPGSFLTPEQIGLMDLPDLAPWFDNASDDYDELPASGTDTAYDE